jgi:hypothetical protein
MLASVPSLVTVFASPFEVSCIADQYKLGTGAHGGHCVKPGMKTVLTEDQHFAQLFIILCFYWLQDVDHNQDVLNLYNPNSKTQVVGQITVGYSAEV